MGRRRLLRFARQSTKDAIQTPDFQRIFPVDQGAVFLDDIRFVGGKVHGFPVVAGMVVEFVGVSALGVVADEDAKKIAG